MISTLTQWRGPANRATNSTYSLEPGWFVLYGRHLSTDFRSTSSRSQLGFYARPASHWWWSPFCVHRVEALHRLIVCLTVQPTVDNREPRCSSPAYRPAPSSSSILHLQRDWLSCFRSTRFYRQQKAILDPFVTDSLPLVIWPTILGTMSTTGIAHGEKRNW